MSDFLAPILFVVDNEVDSFWCFVGLMDRLHGNFEMDQALTRRQLMQLRDLVVIVNPKLANYLGRWWSETGACRRLAVCRKPRFGQHVLHVSLATRSLQARILLCYNTTAVGSAVDGHAVCQFPSAHMRRHTRLADERDN